jgi:hypothetical protein
MHISRYQARAVWTNAKTFAMSTPTLLFAFFLFLYLYTNDDQVLSYDGMAMFHTTRSLADHGSLAIDGNGGALGRDGHYYSKYGLGLSLVELPLYLVGRFIGSFAHTQYERIVPDQIAQAFTLLTNPIIMALACVVFYHIVRTLGYRVSIALRAAFVLGIATSFWPYSKTDFSEPLLTLCLEVAVLCTLLIQRGQEDRKREAYLALAAGSALGFAILTKYAALVYVPIICLYVTMVGLPTARWSVWLRQQIALLLPVFCAGISVLVVNVLRFGSVFATGYDSSDRPLTFPLTEGVAGLLFSPGRGLLFYDPLLFLGLLALGVTLWYRRRESVLAAGLIAVSLLLYGSYAAWSGGADWGPRYLVPIMPYLLLPLVALGGFGADAPVLSQAWMRPIVNGMRALVIIFIGASVVVQILGVSVNYIAYDIYWTQPDGTVAPPIYDFLRSPLVFAVWLIPLSFHFSFANALPTTGFTSQDFPFAAPYPPNPNMPGALGSFYIDYFWFTPWPHQIILFLAGTLVLGVGMILTGRILLKRQRTAPLSGHWTAQAALDTTHA